MRKRTGVQWADRATRQRPRPRPHPLKGCDVSDVTCGVADCSNSAVTRGWCSAHYQRWQRWGDPVGKNAMVDRVSAHPVRFWSLVNKGPECWVWNGTRTDKGHGLFHYTEVKGHPVQETAHRYAYKQLVGPIPEGLHLDHLCRNPPCVNPDHTEPVTPRENVLRGDGVTAVNARKTHCDRGHEFTHENTYVPSTRRERVCRACLAIRQAAYYRRKSVGAS